MKTSLLYDNCIISTDNELKARRTKGAFFFMLARTNLRLKEELYEKFKVMNK